MPHDPDAERALLGAVLHDAARLDEVRAIIGDTPTVFWSERNGMLWTAMVKTPPGDGVCFDSIALKSTLGESKFKKLGGFDYLGELVTGVPNSSRVVEYARIVADHCTRRQIIQRAHKLMTLGYDTGQSLDLIARGVDELKVVTPKPKASDFQPILVSMSDIETKPIDWLWNNRIARSTVTMLFAPPGKGKSFVTQDLAARISSGAGFPDTPNERQEPGHVILVSCEDDPSTVLRPRLERAAAGMDHIHLMYKVRPDDDGDKELLFNIERDIETLQTAVNSIGGEVKMVVIDPLGAYMGRCDTHKHSEVYNVLSALVVFAEKNNLAVLCVQHENKSLSSQSVQRAMGSVAFQGVARITWFISDDPDSQDPRDRLFVQGKANLGPAAAGMRFRIEAPGIVMWDSELVNQTADETFHNEANQRIERDSTQIDQAVEWLQTELKSGPVDSKYLNDKALNEGISGRTLSRAKKKLGVKAEQQRDGDKVGKWTVELPGWACLQGNYAQ